MSRCFGNLVFWFYLFFSLFSDSPLRRSWLSPECTGYAALLFLFIAPFIFIFASSWIHSLIYCRHGSWSITWRICTLALCVLVVVSINCILISFFCIFLVGLNGVVLFAVFWCRVYLVLFDLYPSSFVRFFEAKSDAFSGLKLFLWPSFC